MKPAPFEFATVASTGDAAAELVAAGSSTKLIAGAQSLGPMLNLRLVRPGKLVNVAMLPALREVRETEAGVEIGAAITHAEIEDGEVPDPTGGWLQEAASNIAHRAVRNRGTIGGSLAHADPAADWVIVMVGLGATILVDGPGGRHEIAAGDFVTGPFETALRKGELISAIGVSRPPSGARWGYWKFVRQVGEFAKASATVLIDPDSGPPRVAIGALGHQPIVLGDDVSARLVAGEIAAADALSGALPDRAKADLMLHIAALKNALAKAGVDGSEGASS